MPLSLSFLACLPLLLAAGGAAQSPDDELQATRKAVRARYSGDHPGFTYNGSAVLFNGWEGAQGPNDCEPLMVLRSGPVRATIASRVVPETTGSTSAPGGTRSS